ncbi:MULTISPECIES: helix-turn-helix domain-containing protein [unclassified Streptomyces]|uniref:HTH cro/C1-type domain-containing protein n=1 Tax=Streptomyces sp. F11 TaxID=319318 RepID=Q58IS2_9ACTN|nr:MULTISPECIES: helix-turn-helix transcriptional regulator [unclassified Streptomyces]AAX51311.1 unknown [Streptomyces sp. F11]UJV47324.1 XRE family transcriptional regulator [Streptomyces sp. AMCC400023]
MAAEKPIPADVLPELRALATQLRDAKVAAGVSYKKLSENTHYSTATLSQAASGKKLPTWDVTKAYANGCGDPRGEEFWMPLWQAASDAVSLQNAADLTPEDPPVQPQAGRARRRRKSVADLVREEMERQQRQHGTQSQSSADAIRTALALCVKVEEFRSLLKELKGGRSLDDIKDRARDKGYTIRKFNIATMIGDDGNEVPDTELLHAYLVGCDVEPAYVHDWHHAATRLKISQAMRAEPNDEGGFFQRLYRWMRRIRSELRLEALIGLVCTVVVAAVQVASMLQFGF